MTSCTCHLLPGPYPGQSRPLCGACADTLRKRLAAMAGELEKCLQRAHTAEQRVRELEAAYGDLRRAVWSVPGEPPDDGADMTHEETRRQAVDQAVAFEHRETP